MIKVFYGNDRLRANQEIKKNLGMDYEVIEGSSLELSDLPNIFLGNSLLSEQRRILIRDLIENKHVSEAIVDYLESPHKIVILETKINKNSVFYKSLQKKIEFMEFKLPEVSLYREAQNIYNTAKRDGKKAVGMLDKIKYDCEPIAFIGMINAIALGDFEVRQGKKEKRALLELSKLDIEIKTTSYSPWILLQAFLLRLSSL